MPPSDRTMGVTLDGLRKGQEVYEADLNFLRSALASSALNPDLISHRAASTRRKGPTFAHIADELDKLPPMATSLQALATKNLPASGARLVRIINELTILSTKLDSPRRRAGIEYVMDLLTDPMLVDMVKLARFLRDYMSRIHDWSKEQARSDAQTAAENERRREEHLASAERANAGNWSWRHMDERERERKRNEWRRQWEQEPERPPTFGEPPKTKWETRIKHQSLR